MPQEEVFRHTHSAEDSGSLTPQLLVFTAQSMHSTDAQSLFDFLVFLRASAQRRRRNSPGDLRLGLVLVDFHRYDICAVTSIAILGLVPSA